MSRKNQIDRLIAFAGESLVHRHVDFNAAVLSSSLFVSFVAAGLFTPGWISGGFEQVLVLSQENEFSSLVVGCHLCRHQTCFTLGCEVDNLKCRIERVSGMNHYPDRMSGQLRCHLQLHSLMSPFEPPSCNCRPYLLSCGRHSHGADLKAKFPSRNSHRHRLLLIAVIFERKNSCLTFRQCRV